MTVRELRNLLNLFPGDWEALVKLPKGLFLPIEKMRDREVDSREPRNVAIIELDPYAGQKPGQLLPKDSPCQPK